MDLKKLKAADLRDKGIDQLVGLRKDWRKSLVEEKMSPLSGISGQTKIKQLRKAIARVETVLTETKNKTVAKTKPKTTKKK